MTPLEPVFPASIVASLASTAGSRPVGIRGRDPSWQARLCLAVGLGFVVLALAGTVTVMMALREAALSQANRSLEHLAATAAAQVSDSLQSVDVVLQEADRQIETAALRGGSDLGAMLGTREVHEILLDQVMHVSQLAALAVAGPDGRLANISRAFPPPAISVAGRDFFDALTGGGNAGRLYVGTPQISRLSGAGTVFISRALRADHEPFKGALVATIPLQIFELSFADMTANTGATITLLRDDGVILARMPDDDFHVGDAEKPSDYDGRLIATHLLGDPSVRVVASIRQTAALAGWRRQAIWVGLLTAASMGCMLLLMWALFRQFAAERAVQRMLAERNLELEGAQHRLLRQAAELDENALALRAHEKLLADRSAALSTTLRYIDQGIMMVDASEHVVVYNQQALDILQIPEEVLANRPAFQDVLEYQWQHNEFARVGIDLLAFIKAGGMARTPHLYQRERPTGQIIEIRSLPMPAGGMVRTYTDITERKRAQAQIERAALFDDLTGLPNRFSLRQQLDSDMRDHAEGVSLLYLNLDRFRLLNDALGHVIGDELLKSVAVRLKKTVGAGDVVARTGGDEFAVTHLIDAAQDRSSEFGAALLRALCEPYTIGDRSVTVTVSIGIAVSSAGMGRDTLLRNADIAMYRAKDAGRKQICRYEPAMAAAQQERFGIEQSLRQALGTPALRLAYQPILSLRNDTIVGFEALLRWNDEKRGDISPASFIPIAESTGLIVPLGRSALIWACTEAANWSKPHTVAVNLSPAQFLGDDLLQLVRTTLDRARLPPNRLELEVTEGMLLQDTGAVKETMFALRDLGVSLTLDDFGTGHAGLSYLRRFPFQKFKIDRSFVRNLGRSREADTIVEEMLLLARRLDLRVVAEGVELESQLDRLRELGCDYVQGYLTGRPVMAEVARGL